MKEITNKQVEDALKSLLEAFPEYAKLDRETPMEKSEMVLNRESITKMINENPEWLTKAIFAIYNRIAAPDTVDELAKNAKRVGKFGFDGYDAIYFKYVVKWVTEHPEIGISGIHLTKCRKRLLQPVYLDQLIEIAKENAATTTLGSSNA